MLNLCKYQNACVSPDPIKDRALFQRIHGKYHVEMIKCINASYVVFDGSTSMYIDQTYMLTNGDRGVYTINPFSGDFVYLNSNNLKVICNGNCENCTLEPEVITYYKAT